MEWIHSTFINVVPFLVVLSVLVFIHELGHYVVARMNGVKVEIFSIGVGPEIFGWYNKHGTRWKFSWIPLGGYVKMFHEDELFASDAPTKTPSSSDDKFSPDSLLAKTVWQRIAISIAGPAANYLFALGLMAVLYVFVGQSLPTTDTIITRVLPNSAAAQAGLEKGDIITKINNTTPKDIWDLQDQIAAHPGKTVHLEVKRADQLLHLKATPERIEVNNKTIGRLGVEQKPLEIREPLSPVMAMKEALYDTYGITMATLKSLGRMITGESTLKGLSGPLGIAKISGEVAQESIISLLFLSVLLSINLGLINLFPIPVLDGGHIVLYLIEAIRGKPVTEKIQGIAFRIGFFAVMCLIVISLWNDLERLQIIQWVKSFISH